MKLTDVMLKFTKYGIELCRRNKRGNPQLGGIDVTREVLDQLMDLLKSEDGKITSYVREDGRRYEIKVHELTEGECAERDYEAKLKKERGAARAAKLLPMFMMYGGGDSFADKMLKPPQPKHYGDPLFKDLISHLRHTRSFSTADNFERYLTESYGDTVAEEGIFSKMWSKASGMDYSERQTMTERDWTEWFIDEFGVDFRIKTLGEK